MPRLSAIGLAPAATFFRPSLTMAGRGRCRRRAVTGNVVGLFGNFFDELGTDLLDGSSSSISLAMETPSLVIVGAPHFFSKTTLRPLGPSVTLDGIRQLVHAGSRPRRASSSNAMVFAIRGYPFQWGRSGTPCARDGRPNRGPTLSGPQQRSHPAT